MVIRNAFGRVFGQGLLLLPNFLVSITAAHQLDTSALAAFFIVWTIESQWIAGVRTVIVPAIILQDVRPRMLALLGCLTILALVPGAIMFGIALRGGIDMSASIAIALTPATLGALDCCRSLLSKSDAHRRRLFLLDVCPMAGAAGMFGATWLLSDGYDLSAAAIGLLVGSVLGICLALSNVRRSLRVQPMAAWVKSTRRLLITGGQEWTIFALVGLVSIAVLNELAGPEAVAGIRLAETLLAPLGVLVLAVPVVLAPVIQALHPKLGKWPASLKLTALFLVVCGSMWIGVILLMPESWLAFVVGDHAPEAKAAVAGLSVGAVASLGAAVFSMVLKRRNQLKKLRAVRWMELVIAVPCVAVGALGGSVGSAAAGISVLQTAGAFGLIISEKLSARPSAGGRSAERVELPVLGGYVKGD